MHSLERRITIVAVVFPFLGFLAAVGFLWGGWFTGLDLTLLAIFYVISGFGVTIGYHRLLTHRSFDAPAPVRAFLAIAGSTAIQGAPIHWVADHRKHHRFADEEGDPHSPHTHGGEGWRAVAGGLWHAHTGWLFTRDRPTSARKFAPDLVKDPTIRWADRWFPAWALLGLFLPAAIAFAVTGGSWKAALTAYVWAGLVRVFLLHHVTWSVNSICHMYGKQPFAIKDESRNNWVVALFSLGEGWHHNHHAFPSSARHGLQRFQIDPSYLIIKGMEKLGLARNVKEPRAQHIAGKLRDAGGAGREQVAA
jgi:stearoyl-CoA desaturase (delta-9 desaturase)